MKVMITGAGARAHKYVLKSLQKKERQFQIYSLSREDCDITNIEKLLMVTDKIRPDAIINLAAYTNTYAPETDKSEYAKCYRINAIGPKNLSLVTRSPIIHISTNYVYRNGLGLYKESDEAFIGPETVYGRHKLIGEEYLRWLNLRHFILRTQWLFEKGEQNYLSRLIAGELQNQELDCESLGIPTSYTTLGELVAGCTEAIAQGRIQNGIYNAVNSGSAISIYELSKKMGQLHKSKKSDRIISVPLDNHKLSVQLNTQIPDYMEFVHAQI